ncbi:hypothetical protein ACFYO1_34060 [Nocardia sp. NPDC006044]|uniref:CdiA C-terminal domain-containing protein n=1 Tax=Nocardia sp. NPDC006044 TaxID=3364306 RepID=UPI0036C74EC3
MTVRRGAHRLSILLATLAISLGSSSLGVAQPPATPRPPPGAVSPIPQGETNPPTLSQRIATFNARSESFQTRVNAEKQRESRLNSRLQGLETRESALKAELRSLEARRPPPTASGGAVAQFNAQVNAYNAKVDALDADFSAYNGEVESHNAELKALTTLWQALTQETEAIEAELARLAIEASRAAAPPRSEPQPGNQPQRQAPTGIQAPQQPASGNTASTQHQAAALRAYAQNRNVQVLARPVTARLTPETVGRMSEQQVAVLSGGGTRQFDAVVRKPDGTYTGLIVTPPGGTSPSQSAVDDAIRQGGRAQASLSGSDITITEVQVVPPPPPPQPSRTLPRHPPNPNARPSGTPQRVDPTDDEETQRSHRRENESAEILARAGYDVEQRPQVPGGTRPDYLLDGLIFDNYAPRTTNPRNILDGEIRGKIEREQTTRVVLNLADSEVTMESLRKQLEDWPVDGLEEIIVIRRDDNDREKFNIIYFYPW